jgi:mRNA interferase MazF
VSRYVPQRGDVAWLNRYPQAGHEQSGRRPVLILSPKAYNQKTGLAIASPLTTKIKGYAFEVAVDVAGQRCAILADHVKSIDWHARHAQRIASVPLNVVDQVAAIVAALIGA